jgi:hypothetical protein
MTFEDLKMFKNSLPMGNDYLKKLEHKMKQQLFEGRNQTRAGARRIGIPVPHKVATMEETKPEDRVKI